MPASFKSTAIAAVVSLVIGLLAGYFPAHLNNTTLQEQNTTLQARLNTEQDRLALSNFAVQAGVIEAQADANNYSVAGSSASTLFTSLRKYVDSSSNGSAKQQITEVLGARDRTIAGLAQADPGVKQLLQQIFGKLQSISASATNPQ